MGGRNGNEYQQFEDTTVLDSPVVETQLEKLNFDTQVVDDFDCNADMRHHSIFVLEKEVVLDSEDEGGCASKTLRLSNGLSDGNSLNLQTIYGTCAHQQCSIGSKGFGVNFERNDEQKELPQMFTGESGGVESAESSQAIALEFVDQFLSSNNMESEFSPGLDLRKTVREKSPRLTSGKGPQSLVQRMKFRGPLIKTFEWADNHHMETSFSTLSDSRFVEHNPKETCRVEHVSKLNLESNCIQGFNEKVDGESSEQELDAPDMFDVGFNTQIAAEAMEALLYGPPAGCISSNAYQDPPNITDDSLKGLITRKGRVEQTSLLETDCRYLTGSERKSTRRKRSSRKSGKISNDQEPDPELAVMTKMNRGKPLIGDHFNSRNYANPTESPGRRPTLMLQRQEDEIVIRNNDGEFHQGSTISIEGISLSKGQAKEERKSSYVNQETRPYLAGDTLKRTYHQSDNLGQKTDDVLLKYRRKRSRLVADPTRVKRVSLSKQQVEGELKTTSCADQETRPCLAGDTLKRTYLQSEDPGKKTDDGILKYRRKKSRLEAGPTRVKRVSLSKEQVEEELKTTACVDQETGPFLAGDILKRICLQSEDLGRKTDDGILRYRRKKSRLEADATNVVSGRERCLKLYADSSSAEARDSKLSKKEESCKELSALTSFMKLDTWSHPKGKRALRKLRSHSKAYDIHVPLGTVNGNVGKSYCTKSERITEGHHKTSTYQRGTKEIFGGEKEFMPPKEVNDMDFGLFSNGAEKNQEFGVSSNKNIEHQSTRNSTTNRTNNMDVAASNHFSFKYHKRPFTKNLSKSFLLKELIKLGVPESIPDFTWKDLRRRKDVAHVRVLFSQHLDDSVIKQQKKILARLGISTGTCPMDATHLIADRFVRTRNMLEFIALGKPVVTHLWLESCGQTRCLIDEKNYILRDAKREKEIGFSMAVSVARASQHPLLEGQSVFVTPNIKTPKEMISSLVQAAHGQVVDVSQMSASAASIQDNLFIVSCEEDRAICVPLLDKGISAYTPELILNGIVIQKLEFERHQLFKNHVKRYRRKHLCLDRSL